MKIVLNKCYGVFGVSKAVYAELGLKWDGYGYLENETFGIESDNYLAYRKHQPLIEAVEKLGVEAASGSMAQLRVVKVPDGILWEIDEYDGIETLHEQHRSW